MDFEKLFYDFFVAISPALQTLLVAVFTALAAYATAYVRNLAAIKKAELSQEQRYLVDLFAEKAVSAAEQLYKDNKDKRDYAVGIVEAQLSGIGIKVDLDVIIGAVEAQVFYTKS